MELGAARAAEVAELRVVDAEPVVDVVDELGDEEVEVGVALTVRVRRHVDRHALEPRLEVGAVVEVEAANEVLVRLAVAGVLRDDEARDRLEQLAFSRQWAKAEVGRADVSLGGGRCDADEIVRTPGNLNDAERSRSAAVRGDSGAVALSERHAW